MVRTGSRYARVAQRHRVDTSAEAALDINQHVEELVKVPA